MLGTFRQTSLFNQYIVSAAHRNIARPNRNVWRRPKHMYPCVPEYQKVTPRDPFDYKLRSKEEVADDFKHWEPDFPISVCYKRYTAGDTRVDNPENRDNRERVAKIRMDIRTLKLAPLQRNRFQYLMGPRWNPRMPHHLKVVCSQYNTFQENYMRAFELFREVYWEAKRAPDTQHTMLVNPYRREKILKKVYGKTAEARKLLRAQLRVADKEYSAMIANKFMEEELKESEVKRTRSVKQRGYAELRKKLGYKNEGEEVADPVLDELA